MPTSRSSVDVKINITIGQHNLAADFNCKTTNVEQQQKTFKNAVMFAITCELHGDDSMAEQGGENEKFIVFNLKSIGTGLITSENVPHCISLQQQKVNINALKRSFDSTTNYPPPSNEKPPHNNMVVSSDVSPKSKQKLNEFHGCNTCKRCTKHPMNRVASCSNCRICKATCRRNYVALEGAKNPMLFLYQFVRKEFIRDAEPVEFLGKRAM